jgi:hypothetical protein
MSWKGNCEKENSSRLSMLPGAMEQISVHFNGPVESKASKWQYPRHDSESHSFPE